MRSDDLKNFAVVARSRSLLAASQELGISQPTLSKSIARLERALGTPVLHRLSRGVSLTEAGRTFLAHSGPVALGLQDGMNAVRDLRYGRSGTIRIGLGVGVPQALIMEACRALLTASRVSVEISGGMSDSLAKLVADGQCDFAVISVPPQDLSSMRWASLFSDPMVPVALASHPLVRARSVEWERLSQQTWVVPGVGTPVRTWFEHQFTSRSLPLPEQTISMRDYFATPEFGAAIGAVSLMPASFIRLHPDARKYRVLKTPSDWRSERVVGVLRRRAGYMSPAAGRLIDCIVDVRQELLPE